MRRFLSRYLHSSEYQRYSLNYNLKQTLTVSEGKLLFSQYLLIYFEGLTKRYHFLCIRKSHCILCSSWEATKKPVKSNFKLVNRVNKSYGESRNSKVFVHVQFSLDTICFLVGFYFYLINHLNRCDTLKIASKIKFTTYHC